MIGRKKINPDDLFVQLFIGDRYRPLRHIALVVMIIALGLSNAYSATDGGWIWILNVLVFIPIPILLNVYIFVPRLLLKNRPWLYLLAVVSIVLACLFAGTMILYLGHNPLSTGIDNSSFMPNAQILNMVSTLLMFALIIAGTNSMILIQLWLRDRVRIAELEEASNITELDMLKNQINPHFLFNMLNNAIVLTKENSLLAKEVIYKLREMLNYQFAISHVDRIPLRGDIDFLEGVLHLEKIRRDSFNYHILVLGDTDNIFVPPLLFIPFVENAIKHGNDNTRESYILIIFKIQDDKLDFFCTNSVPDHNEFKESGGIGLKNIHRRLELIYGKDHRLDINTTKYTYNVNLIIGL